MSEEKVGTREDFARLVGKPAETADVEREAGHVEEPDAESVDADEERRAWWGEFLAAPATRKGASVTTSSSASCTEEATRRHEPNAYPLRGGVPFVEHEPPIQSTPSPDFDGAVVSCRPTTARRMALGRVRPGPADRRARGRCRPVLPWLTRTSL
jgi:hypothetical protein